MEATTSPLPIKSPLDGNINNNDDDDNDDMGKEMWLRQRFVDYTMAIVQQTQDEGQCGVTAVKKPSLLAVPIHSQHIIP